MLVLSELWMSFYIHNYPILAFTKENCDGYCFGIFLIIY